MKRKVIKVLRIFLIFAFLMTLPVLAEGNALTVVVSYDSGNDWHYSLAVYDGKLYSGAYGGTYPTGPGRIFAFDGTAWSKVFEIPSKPVVFSLGVYDGKLYAGTGYTAGYIPQVQIYVYDGVSWSLAYEPAGMNIVTAFTEYDGKLYVSAGRPGGPGRVYSFDGTSWSISFETTYPEAHLRCLCVYDGKLYLGTESGGKIYVFDGNSWELSYATGQYSVYSMTVYDGRLYVGTGHDGIVFVFDGSTWDISYDFAATGIWSMAVYDGELYGSSFMEGSIYVYDGVTWDLAFDSPLPNIWSLAVYNNHLFGGSISGTIYVTSLSPISIETTLAPGLPYTVIKNIFTDQFYSTITPQVEVGFEDWVSFIPDVFNNVPACSSVLFEETIIVPDGTTPGDYTFTINVVGDGEILGTQTITVHVLSSPGYIDEKIEELADLIEASDSPQGTKKSLLAKLGTVVLKKEKGNYLPAANQMDAFLSELDSQYGAQRVSDTDYLNWRSRAVHIQSELLNLVSS